MTNNNDLSRRRLMTASLTGLATLGLPAWFAKEAKAEELEREFTLNRRYAQNDTIQIAIIGPGGSRGGYRQGLGDTRNIASKPGVKCIAACDVDQKHLDEAAAVFGPDTKKYTDFRELLANPAIDAVVIGTPDHWHATIACAALKAGKDVYCEKPMTLRIDEGKAVVKYVREKKRVFQTGSQQRSDGRFRLACELVRNNRIGKLKSVVAHLPTGPVGGPFKPQPVPSDFNFDMWLGPAHAEDYFPERTHGNFRWFLEHSGGMMTDWGAHHLDITQWGLGMDGSGPSAVQGFAKGPLVGKNCYNTFPEFDVYYDYPNGVTVQATNKGENGVEFIGEGGTIFVSRGRIGGYKPNGDEDDALVQNPLPSYATRLYNSNDHALNFVECIRSRKDPICSAEVGHRSVTVCHLGNLSLRLGGRRLEWDPVKQEFHNDAEANALRMYRYRSPWKL